jgi:F420-non-reducing hydrogenase large subunit
MKRIAIDPVTRLEGHGRIEIFLDEKGDVANAYFQVPEFRGFDRFCVGRHAEEMPVLTSRICGMCPEAHHLASVKALDAIFGVKPTETARKIRELIYMAFFVNDHATTFLPSADRIFLSARTQSPGIGTSLGSWRSLDAKLRGVHGVPEAQPSHSGAAGRTRNPSRRGCAGGWSRQLSRDDVTRCAQQRSEYRVALSALDLFEGTILHDQCFLEMLHDNCCIHPTYSMGTVDAQNRVNFTTARFGSSVLGGANSRAVPAKRLCGSY